MSGAGPRSFTLSSALRTRLAVKELKLENTHWYGPLGMTNPTNDGPGIPSPKNIQKHAGMHHTHVTNERNACTLI